MEIQRHPPLTSTLPREQKYLNFTVLPDDEPLIAQLPPDQQNVLRSQGTYAKRAEEFGVAIGTIRSRLHRAREALSRLRAARDASALREGVGLH
jgi:DNA-directed RNA polymerase specialized sigma24 family protein